MLGFVLRGDGSVARFDEMGWIGPSTYGLFFLQLSRGISVLRSALPYRLK